MKEYLSALAHKVPVVYLVAREKMQYCILKLKLKTFVMEVFFTEEELLVDCGFPQTSYDEAVPPPYLRQNGSRFQVNQLYIQA